MMDDRRDRLLWLFRQSRPLPAKPGPTNPEDKHILARRREDQRKLSLFRLGMIQSERRGVPSGEPLYVRAYGDALNDAIEMIEAGYGAKDLRDFRERVAREGRQ